MTSTTLEQLNSQQLISREQFQARAILVGQRIVLGEVAEAIGAKEIGKVPLTVSLDGGGVAVLFSYGVAVLFNVTVEAEPHFLASLKETVKNTDRAEDAKSAEPITETWTIVVKPDAEEGIERDRVLLATVDVKRLQLVAAALSKSVVLDEFESLVKDSFEQIEPLAYDLQHFGRTARDSKKLMKHIGQSLVSRQRLAGRVGIADKPDLLWNSPEHDALYLQLENQLEISERHAILNRKLELINTTATTALGLLNTRRGLRLEWYIVILIVVEIALLVYDLFLKT